MLNIAIDGPAGAGKSTIAKMLANKLNILYLDTGAMYRAVAYYMCSKGIDVCDEAEVCAHLDEVNIDIRYIDNHTQQVLVNGVDVTLYIREHHISKGASDVSKHKAVRLKLVELQRQIATQKDMVLDGRDIGTFVLPNASYKFFLTATPEVRAQRRYKELLARGEQVEYDVVLSDIKSRDFNDSNRAFAPLKKADDAIEIDTSLYDIDEVCKEVLQIIDKE